jgi:DNA-binding transcriptional MerR regulator
MPPRAKRAAAPSYSIASVSRLTGVDAHTIRAWERRHGAVVPSRTPSGQRRYSDADVARLQLLRAVVAAGSAIGEVARQSNDALEARLAKLSAEAPVDTDAARLSVAFLAPGLARQIEVDAAARAGLDVTVSASDVKGLFRGLAGLKIDAAVLELRLLGSDPEAVVRGVLRDLRPRVVVVVYQFAPDAELTRLRSAGARLVRGPLRARALRSALGELLRRRDVVGRQAEAPARPRPARTSVPAPLFDDLQIARLLEMPGGIQCECPSHLAALVSSLGEFERYSRECESRSPEDASLHRALADGSGRIRADLEQLLLRVCEHEGLAV